MFIPLFVAAVASNKARNQQPDTFFKTQPKQQNTTQFRAEHDGKSITILGFRGPKRPFWTPTRNQILSNFDL